MKNLHTLCFFSLVCYTLHMQISSTQPIQPDHPTSLVYQLDQYHPLQDDKNNITDAELTKLKNLIKNAQNTYLPSEITKIAKFIYDGMLGPSYERWNVFVFTPKISDIFMAGYKILQNKYIWISDKNVTKLNYTYALFQIWICSSPITGGLSPSNFSQSLNDSLKSKIKQIIDNSIIYRGEDMRSAAQYIQNKTIDFGECRWNVIISNSNGTLPNNGFGYCRCDCYDRWAHFRGYGEFKWNYFMWAG